jgi:hypothetical protein
MIAWYVSLASMGSEVTASPASSITETDQSSDGASSSAQTSPRK